MNLDAIQFIDLTVVNISFLFFVGFIGGLVSGFIGSGGAFVLTPGMMSLGVPGTVAVASNMCHKFPKAMIGAFKRYKYGQVDIKLGLYMAVSAGIGVQIGIKIQQMILSKWGQVGSNLYVSLSFVTILIIVGGYVFYDALKSSSGDGQEKTSSIAKRLQAINLPPMIHFKRANLTISLWFTVPVGLATGMLAATIAVGGFIGVPGMIYMTRRIQHYRLGHRTGDCLCDGTCGVHQLGHARDGRYPARPDYSGRVAFRSSTRRHRHHVCQRKHDQNRDERFDADGGGKPAACHSKISR